MRNKYSYTSTDEIRRKRDELNAELERRQRESTVRGIMDEIETAINEGSVIGIDTERYIDGRKTLIFRIKDGGA